MISRYLFLPLLGVFAAGLMYAAFGIAGVAAAEDDAEKIDYTALENPVAHTDKSIKRGRMFYLRQCAVCHGPDGKSQIDVIADATDLTSPKMYLSGTAEGEIFRSIKEGAGVSMPPFKTEIKRDDDIWHLVNFIQSLWPKDQRPELQEEEAKDRQDSSADGDGA